MKSVAIIGAGIAGLAAAFRLQQSGCGVKVFEAADRVGGRMWTIERDGYRLDTGAMVISAGYHRLLALADDAGLSDELIPASSDMGFLKHGNVHRIRTNHPLDIFQAGLLSKRDLFALSKIGLDLLLAWRHLETDDLSKCLYLDQESLREYVLRKGLSRAAIDHIIESLSMALWFEPSDKMSKLAFMWAIRRVFGGGFLNSINGMGFLPAGLARQLDVSLNTPVDEVSKSANTVEVSWNGGTRKFDAAVIALPLPQVPSIFPQLNSEGKQLAGSLDYASSMHVHFGLAKAPREPSSMIYSNPAEHGGLGVTFLDHNKVPGRAPEGKGVLTAYFLQEWCKQNWDLEDTVVAGLAEKILNKAYPGFLASTEMTHVTRRPICVVINKTGLVEAQVKFEKACDPTSRIQLASDYFSCSSTESSLAKGEDAARRIGSILN